LKPLDFVPPPGHCPVCGKPADARQPFRPFCCERCKLVDLGRWLKGDYRVPGQAHSAPPGMGGDPDELP